MATREHQEMVLRLLVTEKASASLFRKSVVAALKLSGEEFEKEDLEELKDDLSLVPDAYRIDFEDRVVNVWEVERYHRIEMDSPKAQRLSDAFWILDEYGWGMRIFIVEWKSGVAVEYSPLGMSLNLTFTVQGPKELVEPWSELVLGTKEIAP